MDKNNKQNFKINFKKYAWDVVQMNTKREKRTWLREKVPRRPVTLLHPSLSIKKY